MDNKKIGKLIASLRKKQGLTQQELGDKVGVGFRAVSKWERGLTLPDISIINDLSKILGISSDELLTGKINKENINKDKVKLPRKFKIILCIIAAIIILLCSGIIISKNRTYEYKLESISEEYTVDGKVKLKGDEITIIVDRIEFKDEGFAATVVKNYAYDIIVKDRLLIGYGYVYSVDNISEIATIENIGKNINVYYNEQTKIGKDLLRESQIAIQIKFIDMNDSSITKRVNMSLSK